jgi:c-di-GMP-binding flagellar brake protein YcgR
VSEAGEIAGKSVPSPKGAADKADKKLRKQSFADLGLMIGEQITLETISPKRKLGVKLMGFAQGKSILITAPTREGKEILLEKDEQVAVRAMTSNQAFAFESRVLYRAIAPYSYYHLTYPSDLILVEIRRSSRLFVDIPAIITSDFAMGLGDWPKAATVQDISENGAALITRQILGDIGHEIIIGIGIQVSDISRSLAIEGVIRNRVVVDKPSGTQFMFGVEFVDVREESRLALNSFLYELEHRD